MTDHMADDDADDDAIDTAIDAHRHIAVCLEHGTAGAAHCMIACALAAVDQDLPLADQAEFFADLREIIDEREAALRARAS